MRWGKLLSPGKELEVDLLTQLCHRPSGYRLWDIHYVIHFSGLVVS
jgi:hypothetical protein